MTFGEGSQGQQVFFFFPPKYINSKRKTRENVGPLPNEVGSVIIEDTESY